MTSPSPTPRADARRNRETLVAAATRAFASAEERVPLEAIAKEAGVGIGTLYRHFPTREALVEAVYHDQVERLHAGAQELLATYPPARALRLWMDLFADWVATKRGMVDTLQAMIASGDIGFPQTRAEIRTIIRGLLDAGAAAGDLRDDVDPNDLVATVVGVLTVAGTPDLHEQAGRMLDLVMDGLRPVPTRP